jgi:hypothetical protein
LTNRSSLFYVYFLFFFGLPKHQEWEDLLTIKVQFSNINMSRVSFFWTPRIKGQPKVRKRKLINYVENVISSDVGGVG